MVLHVSSRVEQAHGQRSDWHAHQLRCTHFGHNRGMQKAVASLPSLTLGLTNLTLGLAALTLAWTSLPLRWTFFALVVTCLTCLIIF